MMDERLAAGTLGHNIALYSAPMMISAGDQYTPEAIVSELQAARYTVDPSNPVGSYSLEQGAILVKPGRDSYFREDPVRIRFDQGRVTSLAAVKSNTAVVDYALEPQLLARIEDGALQSRRPVRFNDIPQGLVHALVSAEDKHFFGHAGFDPLRMVKAAWVNVRDGRKKQGGSTLTMQLARNLYLDSDKNWGRKLKEIVLAELLEAKLSKQEIFAHYANEVYLGRRHTIAIHGFGQAAVTYFKKELTAVNLPEAALLAGLVQRPSFFDPVRHPDRAVARRNLVLRMMAQNGYITEQERGAASLAPLSIAPVSESAGDSPWFADLAMDDLQSHATGPVKGSVYTTLDPGLQRAAIDAVRAGLREVDGRLAARDEGTLPDVALVALDPHTGEVKALVGGRDFARSQVNHALAMRQPGSVFKPLVYAAALSSGSADISQATLVMDAPRGFRFGGQDYHPSNFGDHFYGEVTMRQALVKSMNVATVSVAEKVGYREVLQLALDAGFNDGLRATPALALGAYEASPLEVAGAYTIFANSGAYVHPTFVSELRSLAGKVTYTSRPESRRVLGASEAFVVQDMMTEVLRSGTGAGVRARGFDVPAAGKTGTSRDGWFAGYVANLICVVWVGYDDGRDLDLEGAKSALPIWTEFMKRASGRGRYRGTLGAPPQDVVALDIDAGTGLLAGAGCFRVRKEYFVRGSEPKSACSHEIGPGNDSVKTAAFVENPNE